MANEKKSNRLLLFEPNLKDNKLIPNEDLSILVELYATRKGRSIIRGEELITNGGTGNVNFIAGTVIKTDDNGKPIRTSLTTDYTEAIGTESLGIETIQIDFDTAYTPLVKIKFIDIRGQAVFSQSKGASLNGNPDSDYSVFFDFPYPLFELRVKGFYGKSVNYCLHLTKFSSSFNSGTGNFEIETEFIGYTYAILTDMLLGLIRAVITTDEGKDNWRRKVEKYRLAGITLKSIDEFIDDISKLADSFQKVSNSDENTKKLNTNAETREVLKKVENKLNKLLNDIVPDGVDYNKSKAGVTISNINRTDTVKTIVNNFKKEINDFFTGENNINDKITDDNLKIDSNNLQNVINFKLKKSQITNESDLVDIIISKKSSIYSKSNETQENIVKGLANLILRSKIDGPGNTIVEINDFRKAFIEVNTKKERLNNSDTKIRKSLGKDLAEIAEEELNFSPTIRNITRILTAHCEVFMETLQDVSNRANKDNKERDKTLKKLIVDKVQKRGQTSKDKNQFIFPWPEYNKKVLDENIPPVATYQETYLGVDLDYSEIQKVPELVFTEHLLGELLRLKERDNERIEENKFEGINYYPVSPLDNPIFFDEITENPYKVALSSNKSNDGLRLLLLRSFLLLGLGNTKLSSLNIETFGKLEAENLANAMSDFDTSTANDIIQKISSLDTNKLIEQGKNGFGNILNPTGTKKPIFQEDTNNSSIFKYTYIGLETTRNIADIPFKDSRWYIPISSGFDGQSFYNNNNLKSQTELSSVSSSILFTSNQSTLNKLHEDGSVYFKIIESSIYEKDNISPDYGSEIISTYNEKQPGNFIKQSSFKNEELKYLNPFSGTKKYTEITDLIYDEKDQGGSYKKVGSTSEESNVLSSFFYNYDSVFFNTVKGGNYLSKGYNKESKDYKTNVKPTIINTKEPTKTYKNTITNNLFTGLSQRSFPENWGKNRELIGYPLGDINDPNSSKVNTYTPFIEFNIGSDYYSLFGSKFYYGQNSNVAKAFLFLNSFKFYNLDDENIKNLFLKNSSFIKAPKLWCAYIGSILYRFDQTNDILTFINTQPDIPGLAPNGSNLLELDDRFPEKDEYLYQIWNNNRFSTGINFRGKRDILNFTDTEYQKVGDLTKNLPIEIRNEFKKIFLSFVDNEFITIQENFEICNNFGELALKWDQLYDATTFENAFKSGVVDGKLKIENVISIFDDKPNVLNTYENISITGYKDKPEINENTYSQVFLRTKEDSEANELINELYRGYYYIMNGVSTSQFFDVSDSSGDITVSQSDMNLFLTGFFTRIKEIAKVFSQLRQDKLNQLKQEIYKTTNDDFIKLTIYRTLASINTKWLGGINCPENSNPFKQCVCKKQNKLYDKTVAKNEKISEPDLIHSFRFLDSAYNDIGNSFFINPFYVQKLILGNFNQSFFDLINQILSDNNFNFMALPNYINYNSIDDVIDVFKPIPYSDNITTSGPSFICQYIGQTSTSIGTEFNDYLDDGVYIELDNNGERDYSSLPTHFLTDKQNNGDLSLPVFLVSYGLQNQSFFNDISITQQETTESLESLQTIEDLSQSADKRSPTFKGQNLWNIYQKRQYKVDIEMLGNPMIQPFMYFQLDDIPLFRGMYAIFKTSHTITPNNMTTKFTGIRTKRFRTPLVTKGDFFMSLISSLNELNQKRGVTLDGNPGSGTNTSNTSINLDVVQNSDNFFIEEGGGLYIVDKRKGLAGDTLNQFLRDLSNYLATELPSKNIKLLSNGVTREIRETVAGGPSRDPKSKHGAGLAIDVIFTGNYNGTKLGFTNKNGKVFVPGPSYKWAPGNKPVANDDAVMTKIKEFLSTDSKWKGYFKWGGDFRNNGKYGRRDVTSTVDSIPNFKVRIDEIHHFELLPDKWPQFFKPYESALAKLGAGIPKNRNDLGKLYELGLNFNDSNSSKVKDDYKQNTQEGDAVSQNSKIT